MPNHATATLLGHATRDPELTYTSNNTAVCKLGLAVNRTWGSGDNRQQEVSYFDLEAWSKAAELINQYVRKGDAFYCTAEPRQDRWQDQQGNNRSKVKFVIKDFQFIGRRGDDGSQQQHEPSRQAAPPPSTQGGPALDDSDIPFHHEAPRDF